MKAKIKFFHRGNSIDYNTAKYWVNKNLNFNIDLKFSWEHNKKFSYLKDISYIVDIAFERGGWSYIQFNRDEGYYVIPTEAYTIEQWLSFNNEDIVEIIDRDQVYDSYYEWVDVNAPQNKKFMWTPGNLPNINHKFKVITSAPWGLNAKDEQLYFIEDCKTKECFLINEAGITNATTIE